MATVMVVEDNAALSRLYREILGFTGCTVIEAASCQQAIEKLETHTPEVIVLDMGMPDGNGLSVVDWMKIPSVASRFHATRVIVASGNYEGERQAKKRGVDEFLFKPICTQTLIDLVQGYTRPAKQGYAA